VTPLWERRPRRGITYGGPFPGTGRRYKNKRPFYLLASARKRCNLPTPAYDLSEQGRAAAERIAGEIPVGRFGTAYEDCTPLLVFLASQSAGYVNGQAIGVDGGRRLIA
jgi:NAD(P)-dependent dehydrogenase (short-subunit alcohol dehydrogenase family)